MNKLRIHIVVLLIVGFAFTSCDEELSISTQGEDLLVLNSIMQVDSPIVVNLSKTRSILVSGDEIDWVRNADVYLTYGDNDFQELLKYEGEGDYVSEQVAKFGESYSIEVVHAKYKNVSASAYMPECTKGTVEYVGDNDGDQRFKIVIEDKKTEDFYIWELFVRDGNNNKPWTIVSDDSRTDNILPDETQDRNKIFLKGSTSELVGINSAFSAENLDETAITQSTVRLLTVNSDMYKYYKSIALYNNSIDNYIEPIEIYSNVDNGLGIFGAYSETFIDVSY